MIRINKLNIYGKLLISFSDILICRYSIATYKSKFLLNKELNIIYYKQIRCKFVQSNSKNKIKEKNKITRTNKIINNDINRHSAIDIAMSKSKLYNKPNHMNQGLLKSSIQMLDYFLVLDFEATCDNRIDLTPKVRYFIT